MNKIKDGHIYLFFVALFIIQLSLVNPMGELPLNDDWVHSWSIYHYLSVGDFVYPAFLSANMHLPILLGIILGKIFGFSFTLLRMTNLIIALASVMIFYRFLRRLNISLVASLAVSLLLWFNPIFFNLSYTYMGDVLTLFLVMASSYLFYDGLEKKNYFLIFGGALLAVLGFFVRQVAVLLLAAVIIYFIVRFRHFNFKKMACSLGLPLLILLVYFIFFFVKWSPANAAFHLPWEDLKNFIMIEKLMSYLWLASFFSLPISLSFFLGPGKAYFKEFNLKKILIIILTSLILTVFYFYYNLAWPGNIMNVHGLGANTLISLSRVPDWGSSAWYIFFTFLAIVNLLFLSSLFFSRQLRFTFNQCPMVFLNLFAGLYFFLLLLLNFNDRYFLLLLFPLLILGAKVLQAQAWSKYVLAVFLVVFMLYSASGTYNYLQLNKARWLMASQLLAQGIAWQDIKAGYDWDGWQLYKNSELSWRVARLDKIVNDNTSLGKYVISQTPLTGYGNYLPVKQNKVLGIFHNIPYIYLNQLAD